MKSGISGRYAPPRRACGRRSTCARAEGRSSLLEQSPRLYVRNGNSEAGPDVRKSRQRSPVGRSMPSLGGEIVALKRRQYSPQLFGCPQERLFPQARTSIRTLRDLVLGLQKLVEHPWQSPSQPDGSFRVPVPERNRFGHAALHFTAQVQASYFPFPTPSPPGLCQADFSSTRRKAQTLSQRLTLGPGKYRCTLM